MPAKKVILFLGPPSSGKTTQGKMAKDAMEGEAKIQHVSTGDLIRENIRAGTDMGKQMAVDIKETGGVRDELVLAAVGELLVSSEAEDILIIDGFPRTLMQAQWIKARVSPQNLSLIVFASGKEDTLKQRALGRRINKKTGAVYSTLAKEGFMKIPEGAEVERREFDSDISQRLSMYRNYESRILPLFQQKFTVDAQGTPASVHAEVMSIMSKALSTEGSGGALAEEQKGLCAICLDKAATHICYPCGHRCGCAECLAQVNHCPMCREPIEKTLKVFDAGVVLGDGSRAAASGKDSQIAAKAQKVAAIAAAIAEKEKEDAGGTGWDDDYEGKAAGGAGGGWDGEDEDEDDGGGAGKKSADGVWMEVAPAKPLLGSGEDKVMANIAVQVVMPTERKKSTGVDVCCCIDVSGSMGVEADEAAGSKSLSVLDVTLHALNTVASTLSEDDNLSIVTFNQQAKEVMELTPMNDVGTALASQKLKDVFPNGQTNLWDGLKLSLDNLAKGKPGRPRFLFCLTDGVPNRRPPKGELEELKAYKEAHPECFTNLTISTFGFGYSLLSKLLLELSESGGGTFAFIPDAPILGTCFVNAIAAAKTAHLAGDVRLHISAQNGAELRPQEDQDNDLYEDDEWGRAFQLAPLQIEQNKSVVIPMLIPKGLLDSGKAYLEATLTYPSQSGNEERITIKGREKKTAYWSRLAFWRRGVVNAGYEAVRLADKGSGMQAGRVVKALADDLAKEIESVAGEANKNEGNADYAEFLKNMQGLLADISETGRMQKALNGKERYLRWGKHYLRAICRAHATQVNTNYMDKGVQAYGGKDFHKYRKDGDKIFLELPAPEKRIDPAFMGYTTRIGYQRPSTSTYSGNAAAAAPTRTMDRYMGGSSGPCFAKGSTVDVLHAGAFRETCVLDVREGDSVRVAGGGLAKVRAVAHFRAGCDIYEFPSGLRITGGHPMRRHGRWIDARDLEDGCANYTRAGIKAEILVDFVLEPSDRVLVLNGNEEAICWGHGLKVAGLLHEFYSDQEEVMEALRGLERTEDGVYMISKVVRSVKTCRAVGFA